MLRGSVCSLLRSSVHKPSLPCYDTEKKKITQFSINEGDIILTYLQDCPQQVLQLGPSGFLLVAHEVGGTGLDLPSGIQTT